MACLIGRLIMVVLIASKKCRAEDSGVKYDLVDKFAELTKSLSEVKDDGEKTRKDLELTKTKMIDLDSGISNMEKNLTRMNRKKIKNVKREMGMMISDEVTPLQEQINQLKTSLALINAKVDKIDKKVTSVGEDDGIRALEMKIEELKISLAETNGKVSEIANVVTVVGGEAEAGSQKCVKVCTGTTGRESTTWKPHDGGYHVWVSMGKCGFKKIPTVTTSFEGRGAGLANLMGTNTVYGAQTFGFNMYLFHYQQFKVNKVDPNTLNWNVEWIAIGYTC